jgi:hypothetical protein
MRFSVLINISLFVDDGIYFVRGTCIMINMVL